MTASPEYTTRRLPLDGDWTLSFSHPVTGRTHCIEATVPGNVEIDLLREGFIDDPYPPDSTEAMHDFERVDDWTYEMRFDAPTLVNGETAHLVFAGVDTIADVMLNGEQILHCENMFIPHEVDVTARLQFGSNTLRVRIYSPELYARRFDYPAGRVSRSCRMAEAYLRKARHMWGWDNAPRLLSAGLWRPVSLECRPAIRVTELYAYTAKLTDTEVFIGCNWAMTTPDTDLREYRGVLRLAGDGQVVHEWPVEVRFIAGRVVQCLPRDAVRLWWPFGYGEQPLYDLTLQLYKGDSLLAQETVRMGIRDVQLDYTEVTDQQGSGAYYFVCNGEKIYINGTNWKPLDALHSRAPARMEKALDLCRDLHCNMVRIWGGGVYEDHDFFDYCDRHGILVWQDFMFACELPPKDEFYQRAVAREAETIIKRLRNHPSLAIWCGDNEVDTMHTWGTEIPCNIYPSHNEINRIVLKNAVLYHDPYRTYVPSSPVVSDDIVRDRRRPADRQELKHLSTTESHLYPGNEHFRDTFRDSGCFFIGETGPFFINAMSESAEIVERELPRARRLWDLPIDGKDYTLDRHQTDLHFVTWKDASLKRVKHLFGRDFELEPWQDLALGVNIVCAEIFKFAIEWSRSRKWRKTGVLWWSLLDMWPMISNYSVVDSLFRPKKPYYWIRQSQQPCCLLVVEPTDGDPELFVANDTLMPYKGAYRILSIDAEGRETELRQGEFQAERNATSKLGSVQPEQMPALWLIQWETQDGKGWNHYICGQPPYAFDVYKAWCEKLDRLSGAS